VDEHVEDLAVVVVAFAPPIFHVGERIASY
jgi:hypothetical protein